MADADEYSSHRSFFGDQVCVWPNDCTCAWPCPDARDIQPSDDKLAMLASLLHLDLPWPLRTDVLTSSALFVFGLLLVYLAETSCSAESNTRNHAQCTAIVRPCRGLSTTTSKMTRDGYGSILPMHETHSSDKFAFVDAAALRLSVWYNSCISVNCTCLKLHVQYHDTQYTVVSLTLSAQ
eukprot:3494280-Pleurochrysis_carterae.AAC.1